MAMDAQQLRSRFAGKCVLIGTTIPGMDQIEIADGSGRAAFGVHGHAVAAADLISGRVPQVPNPAQDAAFLLWAALLGIAPLLVVRPRVPGTVLWCLALAVTGLWYCLHLAASGGMLVDPFPLIACAILAALMACVLREAAERVWLLDSGAEPSAALAS
jgi:CHASE2 domain-containing sensor protein